MFGLQNFSGSCWVNACLQAVFRFPEVQERYSNNRADKENQIDVSLETIWNSRGKLGLKDFFDVVRTVSMPAGHGIGDSHELLNYLCDKLPYLNELCRFKVADTTECNSCKEKNVKEDSVTQYTIASDGTNVPISNMMASRSALITSIILFSIVPLSNEDDSIALSSLSSSDVPFIRGTGSLCFFIFGLLPEIKGQTANPDKPGSYY